MQGDGRKDRRKDGDEVTELKLHDYCKGCQSFELEPESYQASTKGNEIEYKHELPTCKRYEYCRITGGAGFSDK